jgi:hypothetical protein
MATPLDPLSLPLTKVHMQNVENTFLSNRSKVVQNKCSSDKEIFVFIADDIAFGTFYLLNNMDKNMFKYQSILKISEIWYQ